jgi:hypothetical protein
LAAIKTNTAEWASLLADVSTSSMRSAAPSIVGDNMKTLFFTFLFLLFAQTISAQTSQLQAGHTHDILAVKFSPDDSQLISYSWGDGQLILWDVKSGYLIWVAKTEFAQKATERYNLQEFYWSEDGKFIVTKSENGTYQTWDAERGKILDVSEKSPNIALKAEKAKNISVTKDYQNFYLSNPEAQETSTIQRFSRTGTVYDVSHDGNLFAEGGSWGNAAIKITELRTGKSWLLDGHLSRQSVRSYQPSELEIRLTKEKAQRQAVLNEAQARRDKQAAIDTENFKKQVFITFEHYGDMTDPGEQIMVESDEPNKSKVKKSAEDANAIWLRLHNDSPLPIKIPTQSMYLPNPKCFYEFSNGMKILGLCDNREISIWHGLESKNGKPIPYGFDFGSSAILLPKTSVLFAVPREIFKSGKAIRFSYTFQKETYENKVDDYGTDTILRFRESDLPKEK